MTMALMNADDTARPALPKPIPTWPIVVLFVLIGGISLYLSQPARSRLELELTSDYSRIRIRKLGSVRTLIFVRDNGQEVIESQMDVKAPQRLLLPYSQAMFASHLFRPQPQRVLIVGLGAGSMVRFLHHHQPKVKIDALDIDPVVVKLAGKYFGTTSSERVRIITADAFEYLPNTRHRYDIIYMDAFLKPAGDTDKAGVPQRLKTVQFYKSIQQKLSARGIVVFNLNVNEQTEADIETISSAFAETAVFACATQNLAVVALTTAKPSNEQLAQTARRLDVEWQANFRFQDVLNNRRQPPQ